MQENQKVALITGADGEVSRIAGAWPDRRILELLGIELPILLAPMAGIVGAPMAITVAEAGGLARCPAPLLTSCRTPRSGTWRAIRRSTSAPHQANLFHQAASSDPACGPPGGGGRATTPNSALDPGIEAIPASNIAPPRSGRRASPISFGGAEARCRQHFGLPPSDLLIAGSGERREDPVLAPTDRSAMARSNRLKNYRPRASRAGGLLWHLPPGMSPPRPAGMALSAHFGRIGRKESFRRVIAAGGPGADYRPQGSLRPSALACHRPCDSTAFCFVPKRGRRRCIAKPFERRATIRR